MANPTLVSQDTPWGGFTVESIVEALLKMRGLTNDSTTGRTVATAAEDEDAKGYVRRAVDDLHARFPGAWSTREYSVAWTAGDHSVALPAGCSSVIAVSFAGVPLRGLTRDDYMRLLRSDADGGGLEVGSQPARWRVTGFADQDAGAGVDWRLVLRVYPTPTTADQLVAVYVASGAALGTDSEAVPLPTAMQRWALARAAEMWCADTGDQSLLAGQKTERLEVEGTLHTWFDGGRDTPRRMTTRYPNVTGRQRYRRP